MKLNILDRKNQNRENSITRKTTEIQNNKNLSKIFKKKTLKPPLCSLSILVVPSPTYIHTRTGSEFLRLDELSLKVGPAAGKVVTAP